MTIFIWNVEEMLSVLCRMNKNVHLTQTHIVKAEKQMHFAVVSKFFPELYIHNTAYADFYIERE